VRSAAIARDRLTRKWIKPVQVFPKSKRPIGEGWEKTIMTEPMVGAYFTKGDYNAACGSRARRFEGQPVETDTIPASTLCELADACILRHISFSLEVLETAGASEHDNLMRMAGEVRT
jgi:hypothetical protein